MLIITGIFFFFICLYLLLLLLDLWQKQKLHLFILLKTFSIFGIAFFFYIPGVFSDGYTTLYHIFIFCFFSCYTIFICKKIVNQTFPKPKMTFSSGIVFLATISFLIFCFTTPLLDISVWLDFLIIMLPFFVMLILLLLSFPNEIYEDIKCIRKEKKALQRVVFKKSLFQKLNQKKIRRNKNNQDKKIQRRRTNKSKRLGQRRKRNIK